MGKLLKFMIQEKKKFYSKMGQEKKFILMDIS